MLERCVSMLTAKLGADNQRSRRSHRVDKPGSNIVCTPRKRRSRSTRPPRIDRDHPTIRRGQQPPSGRARLRLAITRRASRALHDRRRQAVAVTVTARGGFGIERRKLTLTSIGSRN